MAHKNGAKPKEQRTYSLVERTAAIQLALRLGSARQAALALDYRESTVQHWIQAVGGLAEIGRLVNEALEATLSDSQQAICKAIAKRAEEMPLDELGLNYRRILEVQLGAKAEGANAGAVAMAKSEVHVHFDDAAD